MKKTSSLFSLPYLLWLFLFVLAPVALIIWTSFFDIQGRFTLDNYKTF
ncbi:ABC transporter permease, partial [Streptococcus suis]